MQREEQIKYVFKKAYTTDSGTIPEGTEIILFRGWTYINGGMADNYSNGLIMSIVNNSKKRDEYLVRMKIIANKV
jgi:hypothetical protein